MSTVARRSKVHKPLRAVAAVIAASILLTAAFPVASGCSLHKQLEPASAAAPTAAPVPPDTRVRAVSILIHRQFLYESTMALLAAIWVATVVIAATSIAVTADQAQRYRWPTRTVSPRWEAGWAGRAGEWRAAAATASTGRCGQMAGG